MDQQNKDINTWAALSDRVSSWLSWILVPLMMPTYALILFFTLSTLRLTSTLGVDTGITLIIFGITALLPGILFWVLKIYGIIDDVALNSRKERLIPYIITTLSYLGAALYLFTHGAPTWMYAFFIAGAVAAIINMCINLRWKISAHAASIAGIAAALVYLAAQPSSSPATFPTLIAWLILCAMLGAARIWLRRHTPMQVICGYIVGYTCVAISLAIIN